MEVNVIGYNKTRFENDNPEVISASYARVSRDPRSIGNIRDDARLDVEKARNSNKNIVFGMGHASIAEHVVFNIDLIGVSRFLVEEIESHRLASYTEKSQRYVLFDGDYTVPKELDGDLKKEFIDMVEEQNKFYHEMYPILLEYFKNKNPEKYEKEPKTVEGWAKEDARYIISMATQTQLGMTINARNLETMIRRLRACPFEEAKELADKLYKEVSSITPSLFPYTTPTTLEIKRKEKILNVNRIYDCKQLSVDVMLKDYTVSADSILETTLSLTNSSIHDCLVEMKVFDSAPREFELVNFTFDMEISSTCFAQLKRHRMMTLLSYPYCNLSSFVIPQSVIESKLKTKFIEIIKKTNEVFNKIYLTNKCVCQYVFTNAHSRNVIAEMNLREMYHFCRMRMDGHAQWEIRNKAFKMHWLASRVCPEGMVLACGKDKFDEVYKEVFG